MCTAVSYLAGDHYFGRNLDLEYSYSETVTIMPRFYPLHFRFAGSMLQHHAMIGMAYVQQDYPLYYEATNEKGLSVAGLHFPGNAQYQPHQTDRVAIAPFEFIPWLLGQFETLEQVEQALGSIDIVQEDFCEKLPATPLHWLIADCWESITVECMQEGLKVYENPFGILTNNPPFEYHMLHLADYMGVTSELPENRFSGSVDLKPYSLGMGSMGLPGDMSSSSRFVRAAFVKLNSQPANMDLENLGQFFHILDAVAQPKGCTKVRDHQYEYTIYSSCCNTSRGIYYYKTYQNNQLTGVDMHAENLQGTQIINYPLVTEQQIHMQNRYKTSEAL